jgi:S-methylmethionine-dependent homocysteine/selenocysteine methylase
MNTYRNQLPQLDTVIFLTDGGIETTLIFDDGIDLPDFAAFPLLETADGRAALERYFRRYANLSEELGVGVVLESATWRASADWGARLGYSDAQLAHANRDAVDMLTAIRSSVSAPVVVSGCIGPRGDGYDPGQVMTVDQARAYHSMQVRSFAASDADMVSGITMTNVPEAIGLATAAAESNIPVALSFTVETDGALPTGQSLGDAINEVDRATDSYAAYYQINCAHPTHFNDAIIADSDWATRIRGLRANASTMSHAELDEAETLDRGNPAELAEHYSELRRRHPQITVLGGCCGTDHTHVGAIGRSCLSGT